MCVCVCGRGGRGASRHRSSPQVSFGHHSLLISCYCRSHMTLTSGCSPHSRHSRNSSCTFCPSCAAPHSKYSKRDTKLQVNCGAPPGPTHVVHGGGACLGSLPACVGRGLHVAEATWGRCRPLLTWQLLVGPLALHQPVVPGAQLRRVDVVLPQNRQQQTPHRSPKASSIQLGRGDPTSCLQDLP